GPSSNRWPPRDKAPSSCRRFLQSQGTRRRSPSRSSSRSPPGGRLDFLIRLPFGKRGHPEPHSPGKIRRSEPLCRHRAEQSHSRPDRIPASRQNLCSESRRAGAFLLFRSGRNSIDGSAPHYRKGGRLRRFLSFAHLAHLGPRRAWTTTFSDYHL